MLKPLQLDMFAYVKQAAAIGAGMILNSQNDSTCSQYGSFQQWIYNSNLSDESQIMKFGSIIGNFKLHKTFWALINQQGKL